MQEQFNGWAVEGRDLPQILISRSLRLQASSHSQWFLKRLNKSQLAYQKNTELYHLSKIREAMWGDSMMDLEPPGRGIAPAFSTLPPSMAVGWRR